MTAASSSSTGGAFDPFGDPAAGCEPYWYQGYPSAYYGQSHVDFRRKCRDFVETEIKPYLDGWIERREAYPLSLHAKSLEAGLPTAGLAKDVQSRYPAAILPDGGFDPFHELIYLDELAAAGPGGAMGQCGINSMALPPILFAGSRTVQDLVVDDVLAGRKNISLAISEPTAGSDVANLRATATREGGAYRVSGQKKWITGGHVADFLTLAVRTGAGSKGISLLLADTSAPGIEIRKMETQFDTCHGTTFITLDNVLIPEENLIGKEGAGFNYLLLNFNHERLVISVSTCRFARLCYTEALRYSMRRKTFGKPLSEHQMIRWKLAEMLRQVEALHDYNERVAFQYKAGVPDSRLGSQCALLKVQASKTFEYCAREASQVFGGASVVREGPGRVVERLYREVRAQAIPGGSEEILLDLAARQAIASAVKAPAAAGKSRL